MKWLTDVKWHNLKFGTIVDKYKTLFNIFEMTLQNQVYPRFSLDLSNVCLEQSLHEFSFISSKNNCASFFCFWKKISQDWMAAFLCIFTGNEKPNKSLFSLSYGAVVAIQFMLANIYIIYKAVNPPIPAAMLAWIYFIAIIYRSFNQ